MLKLPFIATKLHERLNPIILLKKNLAILFVKPFGESWRIRMTTLGDKKSWPII